MKPFVKIKLRAQKHWLITGVLFAIFVLSLDYFVVYIVSSWMDLDAGAREWIFNGMWIMDGIIAGLLIRFICAKPKEPGNRDRPQGLGDH